MDLDPVSDDEGCFTLLLALENIDEISILFWVIGMGLVAMGL